MADPVDYDALADQIRQGKSASSGVAVPGTPPAAAVDYDALAAQAGEYPSTVTTINPNAAPIISEPPGLAAVPVGKAAPGMADDDLIRSYGYDPEVIKKSPTYQKVKEHLGSGFQFLINEP